MPSDCADEYPSIETNDASNAGGANSAKTASEASDSVGGVHLSQLAGTSAATTDASTAAQFVRPG